MDAIAGEAIFEIGYERVWSNNNLIVLIGVIVRGRGNLQPIGWR